jgi:hypothetical protein
MTFPNLPNGSKRRCPTMHRPAMHRPTMHRPTMHRPTMHRPTMHRIVLALLIASCFAYRTPALAGNSVSGANAITVAAGDTGTCALSPCLISLKMPPGDGRYQVTGNQIDIGTYPAGQTVRLGNFFDSQALAIKGAGVPKAYVYILKSM